MITNRSRLNTPLFAAALLVGCNALFDIEEGTLVEGEAGDAGTGGSSATGGNGGSGGKGGSNGGKGGSSGSTGGSSGGTGGSGGSSGGTGGSSGGTGGSSGGTGGSSGGTGGSSGGTGGSNGGTGTAGVATGGRAGAAGAPGISGAAGGGSGPFVCKGTTPTCTTISRFAEWGIGDFFGGASVFGSGITQDMSDLDVLHVTGMVTGYGHGFNLWFGNCSDLSTATGITFTLRGTTTDVMPNLVEFQLQTNSTYPWEPFPPLNQKGACTAPVGSDPWGYCISPASRVTLNDSPQTVTWTQVMGGAPVPFDPATSPAELVGLQWQFPWTATSTAYTVDVTLDDVKLTGITPETDCGT